MYNLTLLRQLLSLVAQLPVYFFVVSTLASYKMTGEGAFYIVTVSGGTVVDKQSNGILDKNAEAETTSQHWTIEYGDKPNVVAFQNASTGAWLRAFTGAAYGKVDCGEKQWWTLEKGASPGSCWIKCNDYPDAYLCNANGSYVNKNKVYTWPKQLNWTHALTWHLKDANSPGFMPNQWSSSSKSNLSSGGEGFSGSPFASGNSFSHSSSSGGGPFSSSFESSSSSSSDLQKKIKDLEAREKSLADSQSKLKEVEGREATLAEKEKRLAELEKKEADLQKRENDLAAKEAAQKKQADQLAASEKEADSRKVSSDDKDVSSEEQDLQKKLDELHQTEQEVAAKEASAAKREETTAAKEEELKAKEADLEKKLRELGGQDAAAIRLENDNLKLQLMVKELEKELEAAKRSGAVGTDKSSGEEKYDAQFERVKKENERLKNLIAQQFLNAPGKNSSGNGSAANKNGGPSPGKPSPGPASKAPSAAASKSDGPSPASNETGKSVNKQPSSKISQPSSDKPSANTSRPVTKATGTKTDGTSRGPKNAADSSAPEGKTHSPTETAKSNNSNGKPAATSKPKPPQLPSGQAGKSQANTAPPKPSSPAAGASDTTPSDPKATTAREPAQQHSPAASHGASKAPVHYSCGHVVYPLPRKLNRKVQGILYQ